MKSHCFQAVVYFSALMARIAMCYDSLKQRSKRTDRKPHRRGRVSERIVSKLKDYLVSR